MKKFALFLALVMIFTLCGCEKKEPSVVCTAVIEEIGNGTMTVRPVEGSSELSSGDLFTVAVDKMHASREPQKGDVVEITYSGYILEIYPCIFDKVTSVKLIEK